MNTKQNKTHSAGWFRCWVSFQWSAFKILFWRKFFLDNNNNKMTASWQGAIFAARRRSDDEDTTKESIFRYTNENNTKGEKTSSPPRRRHRLLTFCTHPATAPPISTVGYVRCERSSTDIRTFVLLNALLDVCPVTAGSRKMCTWAQTGWCWCTLPDGSASSPFEPPLYQRASRNCWKSTET